MTLNNKYEIIRTIIENDFQRILECRDEETKRKFINNIIFNHDLIQLIDEDKLKKEFKGVINTNKTIDRLYIMTELKDGENLIDYINNNKLTLKHQFSLAEDIIKLATKINNMSDILQYSILTYGNLCIDSSGKLFTNNILVFEQSYDISDNLTLKRLGDIIHYIFAKEKIVDYNISDKIPPDILKIIVRCLTNEYDNPNGALSDLYKSQIYSLINPIIKDNDGNKNNSFYNNNNANRSHNNSHNNSIEDNVKADITETDKNDVNVENDDVNVENVINEKNDVNDIEENIDKIDDIDDIIEDQEIDNYERNEEESDYINNNNYNRKYNLSKSVIVLIALVVIIPLIYIGIKRINPSETIFKPNEDISNTSESGIDLEDTPNEDIADNEDEDDKNILPETINEFFNEDLLNKTNYTGKYVEIDYEVFYDGYSSLLAENKNEENSKTLFAVIDLEDEKYSYLKNRQIGISVRLRAMKNTSGDLIIEAYRNGKVQANASEKVEIYDDVWTLKQIVMNVGNIDRIDSYIEFSGNNKIWIDSIEIDVLK